MPSLESVVSALNDPVRSGSHLMKVLRVLLQAERAGGEWLTTTEIGERAGIPTEAVGSRIRDLRTQGFNIKRAKRGTGSHVWEYRVWFVGAPENE
jgi:biotin operon repressor